MLTMILVRAHQRARKAVKIKYLKTKVEKKMKMKMKTKRKKKKKKSRKLLVFKSFNWAYCMMVNISRSVNLMISDSNR